MELSGTGQIDQLGNESLGRNSQDVHLYVGRGEKGSHFRGQWPPPGMTSAMSRRPVNTSPELGTRTFNLQICGPLFAAKLAPNFAATDNLYEESRDCRPQSGKLGDQEVGEGDARIAATFGQTDRGAGKWFPNVLVDIPKDILRHLDLRVSACLPRSSGISLGTTSSRSRGYSRVAWEQDVGVTDGPWTGMENRSKTRLRSSLTVLAEREFDGTAQPVRAGTAALSRRAAAMPHRTW